MRSLKRYARALGAHRVQKQTKKCHPEWSAFGAPWTSSRPWGKRSEGSAVATIDQPRNNGAQVSYLRPKTTKSHRISPNIALCDRTHPADSSDHSDYPEERRSPFPSSPESATRGKRFSCRFSYLH